MSADDCGKLLLLQAELDGELDAAQSAELAAHRVDCPVCQRNGAFLASARQVLRGATYHRASPDLVRAVASHIGAEQPLPRRRVSFPWQGLAGFGAGAALAAAIVLAFLPAGPPALVSALVDDHVRALQPGHLMDVISTNQHTVKPWFDGKLDFAPPVKDLTAAGFPLLGGRLDYLHGRAVAVLVYGRGKHLLDVFVWPVSGAAAEPAYATRDGYHIVHWTADGMSFSAVSDLDPAGLREFVADWRQAP